MYVKGERTHKKLGTVYIVFVLLGPLYFEDEVVVSIAIESID